MSTEKNWLNIVLYANYSEVLTGTIDAQGISYIHKLTREEYSCIVTLLSCIY